MKTQNNTKTSFLFGVPGVSDYLPEIVGREAELAEISRLLRDPGCRLLNLAGPGGIGKTRLSLEVARRHQAEPKHKPCIAVEK